MLQPKKAKTIQMQILYGYSILLVLILILVFSTLAFLSVLFQTNREIANYQTAREEALAAAVTHHQWVIAFDKSLALQEPLQGTLDASHCSLTSFLSAQSASNDPVMQAAIATIKTPHTQMHQMAQSLLLLDQSSRQAAQEQLYTRLMPKVEQVVKGLENIAVHYQSLCIAKTAYLHSLELLALSLLLPLSLLFLLFALWIGKKAAKKIAEPVSQVASWAEQLSLGVDNLHLSAITIPKEKQPLEIQMMIEAFQNLSYTMHMDADSIAHIAKGNLTVKVAVRSPKDRLGISLRQLVEENHAVFTELWQVADTVAGNAENIAAANESLALSATKQASAIEDLSQKISAANALARDNASRAGSTEVITKEIHAQVENGYQKMELLLSAINDIEKATKETAAILKAIDEIAFQTNILALNAAIEAARAGAYGDGFAVVSDEVRFLAQKSAESAKQSKQLLENTMEKVIHGAAIGRDAANAFSKIVEKSQQIAAIFSQITDASQTQQTHIGAIHTEINKISAVVSSNAATSEETSAAAEEMSASAELIRQNLRRFQL